MTDYRVSSGETSLYRADGPSPEIADGGRRQDQGLKFAQFWVDHAREAAFWIAPDARLIYVNNAACHSLGYSRDELLAMSVHDIDPGFPRESWPAHWKEIKQRGSFAEESQHRAKNGHVFPVEIVVDFLEYEGTEYLCVLAHDITERKRNEQVLRESEEALRASEARYRTLVENCHDVITLFSGEGEVLYSSPSIKRVLGYEPDEQVGTAGPTIVHPDDLELVRAYFEKALQSPGEAYQYVLRLRHKDGSYRTVESTGTNLLHEPGFHAMVSIFHDITEQREAEEALQRAYGEVEKRVRQRTEELAAANRQLQTEIVERVATEKALRESQKNLQALFNTLDDFLFVLDLQGRILHANPAAAKGLGYSQEELRGRAALEFRPPDQREEAAAIMADILAGKASVCRMPLVRRDGTLIHAETKGTRGKWGGQDVLFGVSRDVSDRLEAERALQAEHTFRGAIVKRAAEGLCVCHEVAEFPFVRFTVWSDRMTEITGYTMDEINRLGWYQLVYPDEGRREMAIERMAAMRLGNDLRGEQWVITRADGEERTLLISTSVLDIGDGATHVLAMMQDATERTRAEQALRDSEEKLAGVLNAVTDVVSMVDEQHEVVWANGVARKMFGPEVLGKKCYHAFHQTDSPCETCVVKQTFADGRKHETETTLSTLNGQRTYWCTASVAARDTDGRPKLAIVVLRDITDRKKTEESLRRSERLASVGTLAAGIAHEINNPIGAITLSVETAMVCDGQPDSDEVLKSALANIQVASHRCGRIVKSVLQFARNEESEKSPCGLGEVIRYATDVAGKLAEEKSVTFRIEISDDLPQLVMASAEMGQVFANLIVNAVQASEPGSCVTVRSEMAADCVQVLVEDRGHGMSRRELARIFDPFYTTRLQEGGTGLGLSISHGIVREHGGAIHAESTPGEGTTMRVVLPISPAGPERTGQP